MLVALIRCAPQGLYICERNAGILAVKSDLRMLIKHNGKLPFNMVANYKKSSSIVMVDIL
jgi:hypothetical protein